MPLHMGRLSKEKRTDEKSTDASQVLGKPKDWGISSRKTLITKPCLSLEQGQRGGTWGEGGEVAGIEQARAWAVWKGEERESDGEGSGPGDSPGGQNKDWTRRTESLEGKPARAEVSLQNPLVKVYMSWIDVNDGYVQVFRHSWVCVAIRILFWFAFVSALKWALSFFESWGCLDNKRRSVSSLLEWISSYSASWDWAP